MWNEKVDKCALRLAEIALAEDHARDDATSRVAFERGESCAVRLVARENTVLAGLPMVSLVYGLIDESVAVDCPLSDGQHAEQGSLIATISGPAFSILSGERTVLNFLQRLCGIATLTAKYVDAVAGTSAEIVDTRKTTPGWRTLEKYAVRCGGGVNHRSHLADMVMFKDNHFALSSSSPAELVARARRQHPGLRIACEADTLGQVAELLKLNIDILMLDNMPVSEMKQAVALGTGKARIEATGGITLQNARAIAETCVDRLSIGALTHSAPSVDLAMDVVTAE